MLRLVAQLVGTFDQRVWGSIPDHGLKIGRLRQSSEIAVHPAVMGTLVGQGICPCCALVNQRHYSAEKQLRNNRHRGDLNTSTL
jgi:hypothetical protein